MNGRIAIQKFFAHLRHLRPLSSARILQSAVFQVSHESTFRNASKFLRSFFTFLKFFLIIITICTLFLWINLEKS